MTDQSSMETPLGAWINLCRVANLPTAVSNILMAFWVTHQSFGPELHLGLLIASSGLLFMAGMIFNDVFDVEKDRRERPQRPIAAGRISIQSAATVGSLFLVAGLILAVVAGNLAEAISPGARIRASVIVIALIASILGYDAYLKRTFLGPLAMASCRFFNILLGASLGLPFEGNFLGFPPLVWTAAAIVFVYIAGITWFARREAREPGPGPSNADLPMKLGAGLIMAALLSLNGLPFVWSVQLWSRQIALHAFILLLSGLILWRVARAVATGKPFVVQRAVVTCLFSLILLDALFTLIASPENPIAAMLVAMMLVPANFLGKFFRPT